MSLEALLMAACLTESQTCTKVGGAYLKSKPELRRAIKAQKRAVEEYTGKQFLFIAGLSYAMLQNKTYQVKITSAVNLQIKKDEYTLVLSTSF